VIFTHSVRTRVRTHQGTDELVERETIVFARAGHRWLAVHEHLSPMPARSADAATQSHDTQGHHVVAQESARVSDAEHADATSGARA
jgi:hypothetical protein